MSILFHFKTYHMQFCSVMQVCTITHLEWVAHVIQSVYLDFCTITFGNAYVILYNYIQLVSRKNLNWHICFLSYRCNKKYMTTLCIFVKANFRGFLNIYDTQKSVKFIIYIIGVLKNIDICMIWFFSLIFKSMVADVAQIFLAPKIHM